MVDYTLLRFVSVHHICDRVSDRFGVSAVPESMGSSSFPLNIFEWEMFPFEGETYHSLSFSSLPVINIIRE